MPDSIDYNPATKRLLIGTGFVENVGPAVWRYEVSGKQVLLQWFSYRKKNRDRPIIGDRRQPSPLGNIQPDHWLAEYTTELLNVLHVLGWLVEIEPQQAALLERICAGPTISAAEMRAAGALELPATAKRRATSKATTGLFEACWKKVYGNCSRVNAWILRSVAGSRGTTSSPRSSGCASTVGSRSGSTATMDRSLSAPRWISGRTRTASSWISVGAASRPITQPSNHSTGASATSASTSTASTSTGSSPWRMPAPRSRRGDRTIMRIILTGLSRGSAPMNSLGRGWNPLQS